MAPRSWRHPGHGLHGSELDAAVRRDHGARDGGGRPDDPWRGDRTRVRLAGRRGGGECHPADPGWAADPRRWNAGTSRPCRSWMEARPWPPFFLPLPSWWALAVALALGRFRLRGRLAARIGPLDTRGWPTGRRRRRGGQPARVSAGATSSTSRAPVALATTVRPDRSTRRVTDAVVVWPCSQTGGASRPRSQR
jgi:hypothetical protein